VLVLVVASGRGRESGYGGGRRRLAAAVFRVHRVCEARCVLRMISAIRGGVPLAYALRGLR
jgi:hypothetical protein